MKKILFILFIPIILFAQGQNKALYTRDSTVLYVTPTQLTDTASVLNDTLTVYRGELNGLQTQIDTININDLVPREDINELFFDVTPTVSATAVGQVYWNEDDATLNVELPNGVSGQMFQELYFDVINKSGSELTNGMPIMFKAPVGNSGKVQVQKAIADGSIPSQYIMGIVTETIANGDSGKVTCFGKVRGINTTGTPYSETWVDGDLIYVSTTTAGALTNVEPQAPDQRILIATVITAHTNGTLLVRPTWNEKIVDLDDVDGTALTTNGQIMVWSQDSLYFDFNYNIGDYYTETETNSNISDSLAKSFLIADSNTTANATTLSYVNSLVDTKQDDMNIVTVSGNTDVEINAAIASISRGTVWLGNKEYTITSTINLKDSVNIMGNNAKLTTASQIINIFTADHDQDIIISGLILVGGGKTKEEGAPRLLGNGILSDSSKNITIENCYFYDFHNGIMDDNSNFLTIKDNYFQSRQNLGFTSLHLRGTANSLVEHNTFIDSLYSTANSTVNAIYAYTGEQSCENLTIKDNYTYGFGGSSYETFVLVGCENLTVENNDMFLGYRAIDLATYPNGNSSTSKNKIIGNHIFGARQQGIKLNRNLGGAQSHTYNIIQNNTIDSCYWAITLQDTCDYTMVLDNIITRSFHESAITGAITINESKFVDIGRNTIKDSQGYGVFISSNSHNINFFNNIVNGSGLGGTYKHGVYFYGSTETYGRDNKVISNTANNNAEHGINLRYQVAPVVIGNTANSNTDIGILLENITQAIVTNNVSKFNDDGLKFQAIVELVSYANLVDSNTTSDVSEVSVTYGDFNLRLNLYLTGDLHTTGTNYFADGATLDWNSGELKLLQSNETLLFRALDVSHGFIIDTYSAVNNRQGQITFRKSHQATVGNTVTVDNDDLGEFIFQGNSGSAYKTGAIITIRQNGAYSSQIGADIDFQIGSNTVAPTTQLFMQYNTMGIQTNAPVYSLDINNATGQCLDLIYNDSDGSPANHVPFIVSPSGDLTITPTGGDVTIAGNIGNSAQQTSTLGVGATTLAIAKNVITITGDGAGNTIATFTGAVVGVYTFIFVDGLVTITDTDAHTANTIDLVGTASDFTSADDTVLQLVFDGTSWYEISRSAN